MKTLNSFFAAAVISIALVSCQKETIEPQKPATNASNVEPAQTVNLEDATLKSTSSVNVRYIVAMHLTSAKPLCNRYRVEIVDANGRQVAPPANFDQATSSYTFYEQTRQKSGLRVARLVLVEWPHHFICEYEFYTTPSSQVINFRDGGSYSFDLYPTVSPTKNTD
jgi:hypothetical protein